MRGDRKRAQDRFFYIQEALATEVTNWTTTTKYADHGGESYSQLENTGILLTAHIKPSDVFRLRKAKYRDDNAKHNAGLGHQSVFPFYVAQEPNDLSLPSKLNVIILACSPSSLQNQASPSQFKILVPFEKNNGYHVELDLDQFLAGYSDIDTQAPQDQAWPKLRRKMRQAEEEQENDSKS